MDSWEREMLIDAVNCRDKEIREVKYMNDWQREILEDTIKRQTEQLKELKAEKKDSEVWYTLTLSAVVFFAFMVTLQYINGG